MKRDLKNTIFLGVCAFLGTAILGGVAGAGYSTNVQLVKIEEVGAGLLATFAPDIDFGAGATDVKTTRTRAANDDPLVTGLASLLARWPAALGQGTMAGSVSVALASNQPALPVAGTVAVSSIPAVDVASLPAPAATSPCTDVVVPAGNTVVAPSVAGQHGVECCNQDPTMDGAVRINSGVVSASGRILNPPLVAGHRGDCWPWPTSGALVGGAVTAGTTITVNCCPY